MVSNGMLSGAHSHCVLLMPANHAMGERGEGAAIHCKVMTLGWSVECVRPVNYQIVYQWQWAFTLVHS